MPRYTALDAAQQVATLAGRGGRVAGRAPRARSALGARLCAALGARGSLCPSGRRRGTHWRERAAAGGGGGGWLGINMLYNQLYATKNILYYFTIGLDTKTNI